MRKRRQRLNSVALALLVLLIAATASAAPPPDKGKKPPRGDSSPPAISIESPTPGATQTGAFTIAGAAADAGSVARVDVRVDNGAFAAAAGTEHWTYDVDASMLAIGSHTFTARAVDAAGNMSETAVTVTVASPSPPTDATPPVITMVQPVAGATVGGVATVSGTASDAGGVSSVQLSVDGAVFAAVSQTTDWTFQLDTTRYADGSHTLTARATDASGNVGTAALTVNVSNAPTPPPANSGSSMTTPEGARIEVAADVSGWTAQQVYELLEPNAYQLSLIGPLLTVKVQTQYASQTTSGVTQSGGVYSNFRAVIYLRSNGSSTFDFRPDQVVAHEYGHVWTTYWRYMKQQGSWTAYLQARGLLGDSRVDSSYNWSTSEMAADDYRMLFGTAKAISQSGYINTQAVDPRYVVPGLKEFLVSSWAKP